MTIIVLLLLLAAVFVVFQFAFDRRAQRVSGKLTGDQLAIFNRLTRRNVWILVAAWSAFLPILFIGVLRAAIPAPVIFGLFLLCLSITLVSDLVRLRGIEMANLPEVLLNRCRAVTIFRFAALLVTGVLVLRVLVLTGKIGDIFPLR